MKRKTENKVMFALCLFGAAAVIYIIYGDFEPTWRRVAIVAVIAILIVGRLFYLLYKPEEVKRQRQNTSIIDIPYFCRKAHLLVRRPKR